MTQLSRPTAAVDAAFTAASVGTEPADDADWGLGAAADALPASSLPLLTAQSMGVLPPHSLVTYRGMVRSRRHRSTPPHTARILQPSSPTDRSHTPLRLPPRCRQPTPSSHTLDVRTPISHAACVFRFPRLTALPRPVRKRAVRSPCCVSASTTLPGVTGQLTHTTHNASLAAAALARPRRGRQMDTSRGCEHSAALGGEHRVASV